MFFESSTRHEKLSYGRKTRSIPYIPEERVDHDGCSHQWQRLRLPRFFVGLACVCVWMELPSSEVIWNGWSPHKTRIQWFGFGCVCALCVCKFGCVRSPKRDNVVLTSVRVLAGWYQRSEIPRMGDARSKNAGGDRRCGSEGGMTDCPIDYYSFQISDTPKDSVENRTRLPAKQNLRWGVFRDLRISIFTLYVCIATKFSTDSLLPYQSSRLPGVFCRLTRYITCNSTTCVWEICD